MEKEGYGYNKHETFDALMACYEKAASEYDEVNEIRQCYFQSAASLILRHSFGDKDEFAPTFIITNENGQKLRYYIMTACPNKMFSWI